MGGKLHLEWKVTGSTSMQNQLGIQFLSDLGTLRLQQGCHQDGVSQGRPDDGNGELVVHPSGTGPGILWPKGSGTVGAWILMRLGKLPLSHKFQTAYSSHWQIGAKTHLEQT